MFKKMTIVALATIMVIAAQATYACDSAKNASTTDAAACAAKCAASKQASATQASATTCASKTAETVSTKHCTSAAAAACGKSAGFKYVGGQYLCDEGRGKFAQLAPFSFMKDASAKEVHMAVEQTDNGFSLVFTGVNESNVEQAMQLANKSMEALGKPAACEYTRAGMVKEAGGCKTTEACLSALADCDVAVVQVEGGAKTVISSQKADKVKALHGILATVGFAPEVKTDSE